MANANFFSPDGGITRYPLEDTEGRIAYADDIDGINQIKIFHPSQTINGITFTVSNGKIIASGTATDTAVFWCSLIDDHYTIPAGNYHASGCPEQPSNSTQYHIGYLCTRNGSDNVYGNETGNGLDFEVLDGDVNLRVGIAIYSGYAIQGTLVFEPMLTEAKYAGIPYRPYNQQSIQHQINDITGVTGVRNWLENKGTTKAENNIVFTVNSDKTVSITQSQNASANTWFVVNENIKLPAGRWKLTGGVSGGSSAKYGLYVVVNGVTYWDFGDGVKFTVNEGDTVSSVAITIRSGYNVNGQTFKPMIKLASDPDDTYVPYAMTNRELTEVVDDIKEPKIIATAAANQTWSAQLTALKAVWDTYSYEQKMRLCLLHEGYIIWYPSNTSVFGFIGYSSDAIGFEMYIVRAIGTSFKLLVYRYNLDGTFSGSDITQNSDLARLDLIMI